MQPTVSKFLYSFSGDLARPSKFDVHINLPNGLEKAAGVGMERLSLRCESGEIPGRTLATVDQKIYGPTEKHPYQTTFNDVTYTFICSDDMREKLIFDMWMNIINPNFDYTINNTVRSKWDFNYRSEYATQIYVNQYSVAGDIIHKVKLIDAFPIATNQLDLNWNDDSYHKLSVTFAFTSWEFDEQSIPVNTQNIDPTKNNQTSARQAALISIGDVLSSEVIGTAIDRIL